MKKYIGIKIEGDAKRWWIGEYLDGDLLEGVFGGQPNWLLDIKLVVAENMEQAESRIVELAG